MPSTRPVPLISHYRSAVYMDYLHKSWSADNSVSFPTVLPVSLITMPDSLPVYSSIKLPPSYLSDFLLINFIITGNHKINTDFIQAKATHPPQLIPDRFAAHVSEKLFSRLCPFKGGCYQKTAHGKQYDHSGKQQGAVPGPAHDSRSLRRQIL